jgi:hypothetical protein
MMFSGIRTAWNTGTTRPIVFGFNLILSLRYQSRFLMSKKDLTIPRKRATVRTSINYRVPLWDRCGPGSQEPQLARLADLHSPH